MTASMAILAATNITWHLIPLSIIISLAYSASRYELTSRILQRSVRLFLTIIIFMVIIFAALWLLSFNL